MSSCHQVENSPLCQYLQPIWYYTNRKWGVMPVLTVSTAPIVGIWRIMPEVVVGNAPSVGMVSGRF